MSWEEGNMVLEMSLVVSVRIFLAISNFSEIMMQYWAKRMSNLIATGRVYK